MGASMCPEYKTARRSMLVLKYYPLPVSPSDATLCLISAFCFWQLDPFPLLCHFHRRGSDVSGLWQFLFQWAGDVLYFKVCGVEYHQQNHANANAIQIKDYFASINFIARIAFGLFNFTSLLLSRPISPTQQSKRRNAFRRINSILYIWLII